MLKKTFTWALAASFLSLSACNSNENSATAANDAEAMAKDLENGLYAKFETSMGDILVKLEHEKAPMTVGNFVALAEGKMPNSGKEVGTPFYDGTIFHRVIPNFMIQGGDPQGTGMGGTNYKFEDEFHPELRHSGPGILSMANSGPGTNGSQFFITHVATPHLDDRHSVFGKVVEGQDIVIAIGNTPRGANDKPNEDVVLKKLTIVRVGKDVKKYDGLAAFEKGKADRKKQAEESAAKMEAMLEEYKKEGTTTESGLIYIVKNKGNGPKPMQGQQVKMHYAGYFLDGKLFDTSIKSIAEANGQYNPGREPYEPFPVEFGPRAGVIEGWKEAMKYMRQGTQLRIIVPPHLAYGERGAGGVIPPNATLMFDVEMVEIVK
ncbi:MAG: peptidylprolyl isomerase [Schleiferiaceae bacterium]|nr:peptidylprolyl isomerase [Schleiferiaceae bacterium]